jgi:hypothetical protein
MPRRGPDAVALATLILGATSTFVTVVVNRAQLGQVLRIFAARARRDAGEGATIRVDVDVRDTIEVVVETNDDQGQQRVEVRVRALLDSGRCVERRR